MKTKRKANELEVNVAEGPRIKTLDFRLGVTDCGLEETVKRSFDLAKSAGRELDVLFCLETK